MSDTDDSLSLSDPTSLLGRAPKANEYLQRLLKDPDTRPYGGAHSAAFLRQHGLIDDEVKAGKKLMTAAEAQAEYGPRWYETTVFTGRERVTQLGHEELAKKNPKT
jgi:acyl-CoA reductase-like NAD-dependent aldehyde dehydrogenase